MKRSGLMLTPLTLLVVSGCAPQVDIEAERSALREAAVAYHEAASALNAEAVVALYAEDAVLMPPNADQIAGLDNIRGFVNEFVDTPGFEARFGPPTVEVSLSGDLGWTVATSEMTFEGPDGEPVVERIRDLHLWKKQADGSWKVVVDIWNSEMPAPDSTD
jgi:uncharacterized protein (TIGR02246 family)